MNEGKAKFLVWKFGLLFAVFNFLELTSGQNATQAALCTNLEEDTVCEQHARNGSCAGNDTLLEVCRWSCGNCRDLIEGEGLMEITTRVAEDVTDGSGQVEGSGEAPTTPSPACRDTDERCAFWASNEECSGNPAYMLRYCPQSCDSCNYTAPSTEGSQSGTQTSGETTDTADTTPTAPPTTAPPTTAPPTTAPPTTVPPSTPLSTVDCVNNDALCSFWAFEGECDVNPEWMQVNCRLSCNSCDFKSTTQVSSPPATAPEVTMTTEVRSSLTTTPPAAANCQNNDTSCEFWASRGECDVNPDWMLVNCRLSCNSCDFVSELPSTVVTGPPATSPESTATTTTTTDVPVGLTTTLPDVVNCQNNDTSCEFWALEGECDTNPDWMLVNCRLSCSSCGFISTIDLTRPPATSPEPSTTTERQSSLTTTPLTAANCQNNDTSCEFWASRGECDFNPDWMLVNCRLSCNSCDFVSELPSTVVTGPPATSPESITATSTTSTTMTTSTTTSPATVECQNNGAFCEFWAFEGECEANRDWMLVNCKLSCNSCDYTSTTEFTRPPATSPESTTMIIEGSKSTTTTSEVTSTPIISTKITEATTGSTTALPNAANCQNNDISCELWALEGECEINADWMLVNCRLSCGSCDLISTTEFTSPPATSPETTIASSTASTSSSVTTTLQGAIDCQNSDALCEFWAFEGECEGNSDWMLINCKLSCNSCDFVSELPSTVVTGPPATSTVLSTSTEVQSSRTTSSPANVECQNIEAFCEFWATEGECDINPEWMLINCRLSCNSCDFVSELPSTVVTGPPATSPEAAATTTMSTSITTSTTTSPVTVECQNNEPSCEIWALEGECEANRDWMLVNCKLSCNSCDFISTTEVTRPPATASESAMTSEVRSSPTTTEVRKNPSTTAQPEVECLDTDLMCSTWALDNECSMNPDWMLVNCPVSCGSCGSRGTTVQGGRGTTDGPGPWRPGEDVSTAGVPEGETTSTGTIVQTTPTSAATTTTTVSSTSEAVTTAAQSTTTTSSTTTTTTTTTGATHPPSTDPQTQSTSTATTAQQPVGPQSTTGESVNSTGGGDVAETAQPGVETPDSANTMTTTGRPGTPVPTTTATTTPATTTSASPGLGFYVSNETHILLVTDNGQTKTGVVEGENIVGVAVDLELHYLFWSDLGPSMRGIYRSDLDGFNAVRIIDSDVGEVNGLSLDWVSRHVYWTDAERRVVEMSDYDGIFRRIVVSSGLQQPRGVYADPVNGYLFFTDQGTRCVERTRLDGSERTVIAQEEVYWPNQITVDYTTQRVYWVDAWKKKLYSAPVSGGAGDVTVSADLVQYVAQNPAFGVVMVEGTAVVSVWGNGQIWKINTEENDAVPELVVEGLAQEVLFNMASTNHKTQPAGSHPCGSERGGCAFLCVPTTGEEYRCACPSYGGRVLDTDRLSCVDPEEVVLFAEAGTGFVGFIGGVDSQRYIIGRSPIPVAVGYDPIDRMVYWSDVKERAVYRSHLFGFDSEVFLNASSGIGSVDGLFVDWVNRKLYLSNMDMVTVDGTAFTWHRIETVSLDRAVRRVVVTSVEQPRGIHVDMQNNYLYYTDWGTDGTVVRAALDGSGSVILTSNMDNPNGVTVFNNMVFVVDSHARSREGEGDSGRDGALYRADTNGDGWRLEEYAQLKTPYGVSAGAGVLYITDWDLGEIVRITPAVGAQETLLSGLDEPLGVFFSLVSAELPTQDSACATSDCEDVCSLDAQSRAVCACPSFGTLTLAEDGITCTEPSDLMLIADMNRILMKGLGGVDNHVYTVTSGNAYVSSYTAVAYDAQSRTAYYSDSGRGEIYRVSLETGVSELLYALGHAVDGMEVAGDTLYFTAYDNGTIGALDLVECGLGECEAVVLETGLGAPRAIAVDHDRGLVYWSEVGDGVGPSGVWVMSLPGTPRYLPPTVLLPNVTAPNALHLGPGQLYVLDGDSGAIFRCSVENIDDVSCAIWTEVPGQGPFFSLSVWNGSAVTYSDWGLHQVAMYHVYSGALTVVAAHLTRPGGVLVYHPSNVTDYCMNSPCEETCVPYPGGFMCTCPTGQEISADGVTCQSGFRPVFTSCPGNRRVYTTADNKQVWWRDPVVEGYDGSDVSRLEVTHSPGGLFSPGETQVVYTATDRYGVKSTCNFNITVTEQAFVCEGLPSPVFGEMMCDQVNFIWRCVAECGPGYVVNQQYSREHACRSGGWDPPFPATYDNMICVRPESYETVVKVTIVFNGTCDRDNSRFENVFITDLLQKLQQYPVCRQAAADTEDYGFCDSVNYDLVCESVAVRRRRQISQMSIIIKTIKPALGDPMVDSDYNNKVAQVEEALKSGDLYVTVDETTFTGNLEPPAAPEPGCEPGEMDHNGRCAVCPVGSYSYRETSRCEPCSAGTYQELEGQTSCDRCRTGQTSRPGAYTRRQCVQDATAPPPVPVSGDSSGDWTIWVIIIVCIVAALVLLIAVICACRSFRRVVKHKGEVTTTDYEKAHMNGNGLVSPRYVNPAVVARPESEVPGDSTPRYVVSDGVRREVLAVRKDSEGTLTAVTRVPSNQATQTRYGRLPSGQVVRMVPVQTVPRAKHPVKARAKKYEVMNGNGTAPASVSRQGMYRRQYLNGGTATPVHTSPMRQTDAGYDVITYPNGVHHQGRAVHVAPPAQTGAHPGVQPGAHPGGLYSGWHSLSEQEKVTV